MLVKRPRCQKDRQDKAGDNWSAEGHDNPGKTCGQAKDGDGNAAANAPLASSRRCFPVPETVEKSDSAAKNHHRMRCALPQRLGFADKDQVVGFVYLGTPAGALKNLPDEQPEAFLRELPRGQDD